VLCGRGQKINSCESFQSVPARPSGIGRLGGKVKCFESEEG
jgi:hypothetical protein